MKYDKTILTMLLVELVPLSCLGWFEPIRSRIDCIVDSIKDPTLEGLTHNDIIMLRRAKNNVQNLPINVRQFLNDIDHHIDVESTYNDHDSPIYSAIHALGWYAIGEYNLSEFYQKIISDLWVDIYGYECPYNFV